MAGTKTDADLEAMTPEARMAWLTGDDEGTDEPAQPTEDEESEEPTGEGGQEQDDEEEPADDTPIETPQGKDWNPQGPGDPAKALKAKNAEIKTLKSEISTLRGQQEQLTALVGQLMATGMTRQEATAEAKEIIAEQAPQEDPEPDIEEDPIAWAKWVRGQAEKVANKAVEEARKTVEAVKSELNEFKQSSSQKERDSYLRGRQETFVQEHPDFYEVVNLGDKTNPLTVFYEANRSVYDAHMAAEDPVAEAYWFGKALLEAQRLRTGQAPTPAPAAQPQPQPQVPAQPKVKGNGAPPSLATVPGQRERLEQDPVGDLTEEELAALSAKDRKRYLTGA